MKVRNLWVSQNALPLPSFTCVLPSASFPIGQGNNETVRHGLPVAPFAQRRLCRPVDGCKQTSALCVIDVGVMRGEGNAPHIIMTATQNELEADAAAARRSTST